MANKFKYDPYKESKEVQRAQQQYNNTVKNRPSDWNGGQYGNMLNDAMNKVLNRDQFSYDLNGDALYQQYKNQYINQGRQAMMDTIGQATALTGGYDNSYAQTVGQQTYNGYLGQLNDKIPELYQMALQKYQMDGDQLMNNYGMLNDQYNNEYGRYRDRLGDWQNDRNFYYDVYNNTRSFDYGKYGDNRNIAYQAFRDAIEDDHWQKEFDAAQAARAAAAAARVTKDSDDDDEEKEVKIPSDAIIANRHSDSWITVGANGRYTYQELEQMVNSGKVKEIYNPKNNTVTYMFS